MEELIALLDRVNEVDQTTDDLLLDEIFRNKSFVIGLNVDEQLFNGLDANGQQITPPYAPSTINRKMQIGQPVDRVTLNDEGDFYDSFKMIRGATSFEMTADDFKAPFLATRYGPQIFGLTDSSVAKVQEKIEPGFIDQVQKKLLGE